MRNGNIVWERNGVYIIKVSKGFEVYKPEGVAAVRCAFISECFGLSRAVAEAEKRLGG